jgi:hypothetical protein
MKINSDVELKSVLYTLEQINNLLDTTMYVAPKTSGPTCRNLKNMINYMKEKAKKEM